MTSEIVVKRPRPHPAQRSVLETARRYNVLVCGRRWGKTSLGLTLAIEAALGGKGRPPVPVGWFAPTYKLLSEVWREFTYRLLPVARRVNGQEHRIELVTGGVVELWTLERPDPARGRKYGLVIVDEAAIARHLEEAWTQAILPTLVDYQGSAWFMSTPKGKNFFHTLYTRGLSEPDWISWRRPTTENPYIPASEVEEAKRNMPELVFRQEFLAEFVDLEGAAIRREWIRVAAPPPLEALRVYQGVDLAISTRDDADYTAIVTVGRDSEGRIWVLDAVRARATFHQTLQLIQSQAARWRPSAIAIEAVQYQAAVVQELLRTTALPVVAVRPDRDKLTRALPLIARYEQGLVWHAPSLPREFEEELLAFPVGEHDDQVDALVYAFAAEAATVGLTPEDQRRFAAI